MALEEIRAAQADEGRNGQKWEEQEKKAVAPRGLCRSYGRHLNRAGNWALLGCESGGKCQVCRCIHVVKGRPMYDSKPFDGMKVYLISLLSGLFCVDVS